MCGRYSLTVDKKKLLDEFHLQDEHLKNFAPRYNIAPSQPVLAVASEQNHPKLELFQWGLVPSWSKDPSIGYKMINARAETLLEKPTFKGLMRAQRCLVIADGFYEWKQEGKRKTPYYIRLKSHRPFGFAGLWSHWAGSDGSEINSCTIITTEPNLLMKPIHNRMPVIIPAEKRNVWLDSSRYDGAYAKLLLVPYLSDEMETFPVSKLVNDPKNDVAGCIAPFN